MDSSFATPDIGAVREAFAHAWQGGPQPRIEDFLPPEHGAVRDLLVRELVAIDVRQRQNRGEIPSVADYAIRFPGQAEWLARELPTLLESEDPFLCATTPFSQRAAAAKASPAAPVPFSVGRYRLEERLGRGGFGEVWRAFDPQLQRRVAVKLPRFDHPNRESQDQFLAEARKVAALDLAGIVPVYDVGSEKGKIYIVSRYIEGGSLAEAMKRRHFTPAESAQLAADVAAALHQAHLRNIVHRDVKPGNILLDGNGAPHVADFGLAITEEEQLAAPVGPVGTYAYMSPEQLKGLRHGIDPRSDVYSLGVVLYQMLTGRLPYLAHTPADYLEQIARREPRPPRTINDRIPPQLERICLRCLAKSLSARYLTAADLAADLRAFLREGEPRPASWRRRLVFGAGVALLILGSLTLLWRLGGSTWWTPGAHDRGEPGSPTVERSPTMVYPPSWRAHLGQDPQELIWPGYRGVGTFGDDPEMRALRVTSDYTRLLQLGELPEKPLTVSLGIRQVIWRGSAGIFLGYRIDSHKGRPCALFQALSLTRLRDERDGHVLVLSRNLLVINPTSGSVLIRKELGFDKIDWPPPGPPSTASNSRSAEKAFSRRAGTAGNCPELSTTRTTGN